MEKRKLKMQKSVLLSIIFLGLAILYFAAVIIEDELFGTHYASWVWGGIIIFFGILAYRNIKIPSNLFRILILIMYIIVGTAVWHYELGAHMDTVLSKKTFYIQVGVMFGFILMLFPVSIYYKSKLRNHYRKIFELGAQSVAETNEGFTTRPYPAGKIAYSREELEGFASFLKRNQIVLPQIREDGVLLQIATEFMGSSKKEMKDMSYVFFQDTGEFSVNISKNDYEKFREKLSFDELCNSISSLFIDFMDQYKNGQKEEILKVLESMDSKRTKTLTIAASVGLFVLVSLLSWLYFKAI